MQRKALGRGLEALIPTLDVPEEGGIASEVAIGKISANPFQPRGRFDEQAIEELAASLRSSGMLQPVVVRPLEDGTYQLVAGERRLRAAQRAGMDRVPAITRTVTDDEMLELSLVENIQREDLNPMEEARAYAALVSRLGLTHDQVAQRVAKSRTSITNSLRLLELPDDVQEMVSRETLTAGHARALLALPKQTDQFITARYVVAKVLSVRRTEALIRRKLRRQHSRPRPGRTAGFEECRDKLQRRFATRVRIRPGPKGGVVEFEFYGQEDLERLLEAWGVL
jgi:ParB family chromosome partitioning protein